MANENLKNAKKAKNDEFYTQWGDIEKEIMAYIDYNPDVFRGKTVLLPCDDPEWSNFTKFFAQNFEAFGLKKLISTSYAFESKNINIPYQPSLYEQNAPQFDPDINKIRGKIYTLDHDKNNNGVIDIKDLKWEYLEGDGDFRSDEVKKLRDESDIIITNPPFSLFREFLAWIFETDKKFAIIGNENDCSSKDIFPLIKENKMWFGKNNGDMIFSVPKNSEPRETRFWEDENGNKWRSMGNTCWYTNIDLLRRHTYLQLMSRTQNLKYNKPLLKKLLQDYKVSDYPKYDDYNAIEVPRYDSIPNDYDGIMGVPVTFLKFHNSEQFEIIGIDRYVSDNPHYGKRFTINGKETYARILIKRKK